MQGLSLQNFFFSSRRRHTRCLSDWSSDVCSSDLVRISDFLDERFAQVESIRDVAGEHGRQGVQLERVSASEFGRSEERRVGKECRLGWSASQGKERQEAA